MLAGVSMGVRGLQIIYYKRFKCSLKIPCYLSNIILCSYSVIVANRV